MERDKEQLLVLLERLDERLVFALLKNQNSGSSKQQFTRPHQLDGIRSNHKVSALTNTEPRTPPSYLNRNLPNISNRFTTTYQATYNNLHGHLPSQKTNRFLDMYNLQVSNNGIRPQEPTRLNHYGGGLIRQDRVLYEGLSARQTEAFKVSLRKYPASSPGRFCGRGLTARNKRRTQVKCVPIPPIKQANSIRSLPADPPLSTSNCSKEVQTFTRAETQCVMSAVRREGRPPTRQRVQKNKTRESSPSGQRSRMYKDRSTSTNLTTSYDFRYDYLKSSHSPYWKKHLVNIPRKHSKRSNKQHSIVMQVCPEIEKIYKEHKKTCTQQKKNVEADKNDNEKKVPSYPLLRQLLELFTRDNRLLPDPCPCTDETCDVVEDEVNSYVNKDTQCSCEPLLNIKRSTCNWFPKPPCPCPTQTPQEYYRKKIYEEVMKWLNKIPVQVNECPENRVLRAEMAEDLSKQLADLPHSQFEKYARSAIDECVDEMPMWNPGSKNEKQQFKNQISDKLYDAIIEVPRHPDRIRDEVKKFVESLHFEEDVDIKDIVVTLVKQLKFFALNYPLNDIKCKETLQSEILELLDKLPLDVSYDNKKEALAAKLANNVLALFSEFKLETGENITLRDKFTKDVSNWFDEYKNITKYMSTKEAKQIMDDLVIKLDEIQLEGSGEHVRNKMEIEINKVLNDIGVSPSEIDFLTEKLMDKVTDTLYTTEKEKEIEVLHQKTFEEVGNWLQNLPAMKRLSINEQYKLTKDIADKYRGESRTDLKNIILKSLEQSGIPYIPKDKELDEIVNTIISLQDNSKNNELKTKLLIGVNDILNASNLPLDKHDQLSEMFQDIIISKLDQSPIATKKEIDDMNEMLLQEIDNNLEMAQLSESVKRELKEKINDLLKTTFDDLKATITEDKNSVLHTMLKEINYKISQKPIPQHVKDDLKNNINVMVKEKLDKPFTPHLIKAINDNINETIGNADMDQSEKEGLATKLKRIITKDLGKLSEETAKDFLFYKLLNLFNTNISKAQIPEEKKEILRQRINFLFEDNLNKPFTNETREKMRHELKSIMNEMAIPQPVFDKFVDKVNKYLDEIPSQTPTDYIQDNIVKDIRNTISNLPLPKIQLDCLLNDINGAVAESLNQPRTRETRQQLEQAIRDAVDKTDLPSREKRALMEKLLADVTKHDDQLPYEMKEDYAKNKLLLYTKETMDRLPISSSMKTILPDEFSEKFKEINGNDLENNRNLVRDTVKETIPKSGLPPQETNKVTKKMTVVGDKIIDEAFYSDDVRDYMQNTIEKTNKSGASAQEKAELISKFRQEVDDIALAPDFKIKKDKIIEDLGLQNLPRGEPKPYVANKIQDLISGINESSLPRDKKALLLNKVNQMSENMQDDDDLKDILIETNNIMKEHLPISNEAESLQIKQLMIVDPLSGEVQARLKTMLQSDIEKALDQASLPKDKANELKQKIFDLISNTDEPITKEVKKYYNEEINKLLDEYVGSKEKNNQLKDKLSNILNNLPTQEDDPMTKVKRAINKVIDKAPIRKYIKDDLKTEITAIISELFEQDLKTCAKINAMGDIEDTIDYTTLSYERKQDLTGKLTEAITDELDKLPENTNDETGILLENMYKNIDELNLPEAKKNELKKKLKQELFKKNVLRDKDKMNQILMDIIEGTVLSDKEKYDLKDKMGGLVADFEFPHRPQSGLFINDTLPDNTDDETETLLENMYKNIDELNLPEAKKNELKKKLKQELLKKNVLRDKDKMNQILMDTIEGTVLNDKEKYDLKEKMRGLVADFEFPHRPQSGLFINDTLPDNTDDETETLLENMYKNIDELNLPEAKKNELKKKLKQELLKKNVLRDKDKMNQILMDIIEGTVLSDKEKYDLKEKMRGLVADFEFPHRPQSDLFSATDGSPIFGAIWDEQKNCYVNPDVVIGEDGLPVSKEINDLKSQLKSADKKEIKKAREIINKALEPVTIKDRIHENIDVVIDNRTVPEDIKEDLKTDMRDYVDTNTNKFTIKGLSPSDVNITKMVDKSPVSKDTKEYYKSQLPNAIKKETKRVREMRHVAMEPAVIKENINANVDDVIENLDIPVQIKESLKTDMYDYVDTHHDEFAIKGKNPSGIKVTTFVDELPVSKESKKEMKSQLVSAIKTETKRLREMRHVDLEPAVIRENINANVDDVIENLDVPKQIKESLKTDMQDYVRDHELEFSIKMQDPSGIKVTTLADELPVSKEMKKDVKSQLVSAIKKEIKKAREMRDDTLEPAVIKDQISANVDDVIENYDVPEQIKESIKAAMQDYVSDRELEFSVKMQDPSGINIAKMVDELPVPKETQKDMKSQLVSAIKTEMKITREMRDQALEPVVIRDHINANVDDVIENLDVPEQIKESFKTDIEEYVDDRNLAFARKGQDPSGLNITKIVDKLPVSQAIKSDLKPQLVSAIEKKTKRTKQMREAALEPIVIRDHIKANLDDVIENLDVPEQIKESIKADMQDYVSDHELEFGVKIQDPSGVNITKIVEKLPVSQALKSNLKPQLMSAIEKKTAKTREMRDAAFEPGEISDQIRIKSDSIKKETRKAREFGENESSFVIKKERKENGYADSNLSMDESGFPRSIIKTSWKRQEEVIRAWIDDLPITLCDVVLNQVMKDIANDVADRKKYLKLFPAVMKSPEDELDNLKYQIFRRLGKVLDETDMTTVTHASADLMAALRDDETPEFMKGLRPSETMIKDARMYKQRLKDIVDETFPNLSDISEYVRPTLEDLKNDLVDAFFDLNYTGGTQTQRAVLKLKISDEVDKFCVEYLDEHPDEPLDHEMIKRKLYEALSMVPLPAEATMRSEIEKMRRKRKSCYPPKITPRLKRRSWHQVCSLPEEDEDYLKSLKDRTCMAPDCLSSIMKKLRLGNICPKSANASCQTNALETPCSFPKSRPSICSRIPPMVSPVRRTSQSESQTEILPEVLPHEAPCTRKYPESSPKRAPRYSWQLPKNAPCSNPLLSPDQPPSRYNELPPDEAPYICKKCQPLPDEAPCYSRRSPTEAPCRYPQQSPDEAPSTHQYGQLPPEELPCQYPDVCISPKWRPNQLKHRKYKPSIPSQHFRPCISNPRPVRICPPQTCSTRISPPLPCNTRSIYPPQPCRSRIYRSKSPNVTSPGQRSSLSQNFQPTFQSTPRNSASLINDDNNVSRMYSTGLTNVGSINNMQKSIPKTRRRLDFYEYGEEYLCQRRDTCAPPCAIRNIELCDRRCRNESPCTRQMPKGACCMGHRCMNRCQKRMHYHCKSSSCPMWGNIHYTQYHNITCPYPSHLC